MIPLTISNGKAYVWDLDVISTLRTNHRICGLLSGTLPHMGSQNVFLGLPLVLMPEEVVLLVNERIAYLVDDQAAHTHPSSQQLLDWRETLTKDIDSQLVAESSNAAPSPVIDSQAANQKRLARQEKKKTQPRNQDLFETLDETPKEKPNQQALYSLVIPGQSTVKWYKPESCMYPSIQEASEAKLWKIPNDQVRYAVFADLWRKGYTMGAGIKFGGDYLIYPGDPLRYHSHYAASVIQSPKAPLPLMDIVAHGRLGTATKKVHLLCGWEEEEDTVSYFSIEWAGFG